MEGQRHPVHLVAVAPEQRRQSPESTHKSPSEDLILCLDAPGALQATVMRRQAVRDATAVARKAATSCGFALRLGEVAGTSDDRWPNLVEIR